MKKEIINLIAENSPLPKRTRIKTTIEGVHTGGDQELTDHLLESANMMMWDHRRFWIDGWKHLHADLILPNVEVHTPKTESTANLEAELARLDANTKAWLKRDEEPDSSHWQTLAIQYAAERESNAMQALAYKAERNRLAEALRELRDAEWLTMPGRANDIVEAALATLNQSEP